MGKPRLQGLLATALCLVLGQAALAEIYRWTDAQGGVHYTTELSEVPADQRAGAKTGDSDRLQTYSSPSPARSRSGFRAPRAGEVLEIPYQRRGSMAVVQVRLNDAVTAPFIVDTGASDVAIPAAVADAAGIHVGAGTPRVLYSTANGTVSSAVVRLDSVEVGDVRVEGVKAHVSQEMQVGLLGGSFFNNFTFQIDPAGSSILLVRNDSVRAGVTEAQWRTRFAEIRGRLDQLERYMEENQFTSERRVAELEGNRRRLEQQLEALLDEANAAGVPGGWRQ